MTSETELQELRALGEEIAGAMSSPWEPAVVARAFASPGRGAVAFTMQMWIDLSAVESTLLSTGKLDDLDELQKAAPIFGLEVDALSDDDRVAVAAGIERAVREGFQMALPMKHPETMDDGAAADGFGTWLPTYAFLISKGFSDVAARGYDVGCALALLAAVRRNEGWRAAGMPYAQRVIETPVRQAQGDFSSDSKSEGTN